MSDNKFDDMLESKIKRLEMLAAVIDEQNEVRDKGAEYAKALKDFKHSKDKKVIELCEETLMMYEQLIEFMIDCAGPAILYERYAYLINTYLTLDHIPLYMRILRIAALFSDCNAVADGNGEIIIGNYADMDLLEDYSTVDFRIIPVIGYESVLDALGLYNTYNSKSLAVEDILLNKDELLIHTYGGRRCATTEFDQSIRAYLNGAEGVYVRGLFLIDSYVFADRIITLPDL